MKEIRTIISQYNRLKASSKKMALATVIYVEGSSYRREGARMLVVEDGTWVGGISGGCLEGDALRKAKNAIIKEISSIVRYDTREEDAFQIGVGLGCNGVIDVLITPLTDEMNVVEELEKNILTREASILITFIDEYESIQKGKMVTFEGSNSLHTIDNQSFIGKIEQEVQSVKKNKKSKIVNINETSSSFRIFIEFLPPEVRLILFGGNYDIYPLVDIGNDVGWEISVVCNPQKVDKSLFTKASVISNKNPENLKWDQYTAAILMAHDYKTDMKNLNLLLGTEVGYIGMLGPQVRSQKIFDEMKENGIDISDDDHAKIHAPIGLDTGATSPEEIAISIVAEIRTFYSGRQGGFLKNRPDTIHSRV